MYIIFYSHLLNDTVYNLCQQKYAQEQSKLNCILQTKHPGENPEWEKETGPGTAASQVTAHFTESDKGKTSEDM